MKNYIKGIIAGIIIAVLSCNAVYAAEYEVGSTSYNKENFNIYKGVDYNDVRLIGSASINNFWYTGKEYILRYMDEEGYTRFKKSYDMANWEDFPKNEATEYLAYFQPYSYSINFWGDKYIVFNRIHEFCIGLTSEAEHNTFVNPPLLILDKDFNILSKQEFNAAVTGVSYVNGRYYAEVKDYGNYQIANFEPKKTVYVSDDALTWQIDDTLTELPIGGGYKTMIFEGELPDGTAIYKKTITHIADKDDINNKTGVVLESSQSNYYTLADDLYVSWEGKQKTSFEISRDGVYWIEIAFPKLYTAHDIHPDDTTSESVIESIFNCFNTRDKLLFQSLYRVIEYDLNDLRNAWENACASKVYVKIDGNYLGFEQPPVIENGRTLVPMRFIFEQMGAEVDWKGETRTVTATKDGMTVTLAIDDTNATVNGEAATLDVPARLINDKTMIPLRFLSENLGYTVDWDGETRTAVIK